MLRAASSGSGVLLRRCGAKRKASRTLSRALACGMRLNCWNMTPTCSARTPSRRRADNAVMSWPATVTRPEWGTSVPYTSPSIVDLPDPLGPKTNTFSPRSRTRLGIWMGCAWRSQLKTTFESERTGAELLIHCQLADGIAGVRSCWNWPFSVTTCRFSSRALENAAKNALSNRVTAAGFAQVNSYSTITSACSVS